MIPNFAPRMLLGLKGMYFHIIDWLFCSHVSRYRECKAEEKEKEADMATRKEAKKKKKKK